MTDLVEAERLEVGYAAGAPVCAPVDLVVRPGDVVAVIGANGTGKSTLLRTLTGVLPPLAGRVWVLDREVDERTAAQRAALAVDLGDDAFFPGLAVREHLELICLGHGVDAQIADDLLAEFDLVERARALPEALSSGQRRRLLLAAAFARPRRLLVLDEPEQRLDAGMRSRLTRRLADEGARGGAALVVTHDPALVRGAATAVLVLGEDDSRVVAPEEGAAAIEAL